MRNSKIAPIIVGIILAFGAAMWIWGIGSIDYSPMNAKSSGDKPAVAAPRQN